MIQAMYNGVSGLRAHKSQMDVISENIANINTTGYKTSKVNFQEMLSQTIKGATAPLASGTGGTNPMQIGLGVSVGSIDISQAQGSLISTGKSTDLAIEGNGFIILGDGSSMSFTRDGTLQIDGQGNLVAAGSGLKVLGWSANAATGAIDASAPVTVDSNMKIPVGNLSVARKTSNATYGGNLDAASATNATQTTSLQIYDSLGVPHKLNVVFKKTAGNGAWTWAATSPDAVTVPPAGDVRSGTITFNSTGRVISSTGTVKLTLAAANGATNPSLVLDFSRVTQLSGDTTINPMSQDGLQLGVLNNFNIGKDGVISGAFSNGMTQSLGQIAMAQFSNPSGMSKAGANLLKETSNSGLSQISKPSIGGYGNIIAGFLESSNVDLATEFASMIQAQRGFQANSRVITTSDQLLQELVQLKQ